MKNFIIAIEPEFVFYEENGKTDFCDIEALSEEEAKEYAEILKQKFLEKWKKFRK